MYDGTSRSEAPRIDAPRPYRTLVDGRAEIGFDIRAGRTALSHLYQRDPLRVLFPRPGRGDPTTAVLVTTSGGMVGGDSHSIAVRAGAGTELLGTPQAAEKVYGSAGPDCRVSVRLEAKADAALEWLPQETILFDGARLRRDTAIYAASGARVLAGEMLVLGRQARGETLTHGLARDTWDIHRDGRLVWAEALHLDGDIAALTARAACLGRSAALATAVYVGDDAADRLETARALLAPTDGVMAGASVVNGLLVARWTALRPDALRRTFGAFWSGMRAALFNRPEALPRIWNV